MLLYRPVFWSQAVASQLAATVTGNAPPMTKPKKREPAMAMVAGEPRRSSSAITSPASLPASGSDVSNPSSAATAAGAGATARASRACR